MGAKLYLILGLGCASLATTMAASVEPQQKEAEVADRLNKRTKNNLNKTIIMDGERQKNRVFQIFRSLMSFSFPTLRAPVPVREGK